MISSRKLYMCLQICLLGVLVSRLLILRLFQRVLTFVISFTYVSQEENVAMF